MSKKLPIGSGTSGMFGPVTIGPVEIPEPPPLVGLTIGEVGEIGTTVGRDVVPGDVGRVGVVGESVFVGLTPSPLGEAVLSSSSQKSAL